MRRNMVISYGHQFGLGAAIVKTLHKNGIHTHRKPTRKLSQKKIENPAGNQDREKVKTSQTKSQTRSNILKTQLKNKSTTTHRKARTHRPGPAVLGPGPLARLLVLMPMCPGPWVHWPSPMGLGPWTWIFNACFPADDGKPVFIRRLSYR